MGALGLSLLTASAVAAPKGLAAFLVLLAAPSRLCILGHGEYGVYARALRCHVRGERGRVPLSFALTQQHPSRHYTLV